MHETYMGLVGWDQETSLVWLKDVSRAWYHVYRRPYRRPIDGNRFSWKIGQNRVKMASRATCGLFPGYLHVFTGFFGGLSAVLSAFHHFKTHLGPWKVPARVHFGLFMVQMPPKWVKMASRGTYGLLWLVLRVLADTSGLLGWFRHDSGWFPSFSDQYRSLKGVFQGSFWPFYGPNASKIGENGLWGHLWTIVGVLTGTCIYLGASGVVYARLRVI